MRLIDRSRVMIAYLANLGTKNSHKAKCEALFKAIDEAPVVDAEPVRHGKWLKGMMPTYGGWKCSLCEKAMVLPKPNFCPNCGAKMDGDKDAAD